MRDQIKHEFATKLSRMMGERGLSQSDVARAIARHLPSGKFGRDNVSNWCRGIHLPHDTQLHALASVLRVKPEELLPTKGLPSAPANAAPISLRSAENGMAWLSINTTVPFDKALKIMQLLQEA